MTVGLTIAIATIFALCLPVVALFGGSIAYTITLLEISILERTFQLGYETLEEYNSFLDLTIPYISMFLLIDDNKIFHMDFNFFPLKCNVEDPPYSSESPDINPDIIIKNPFILYAILFGYKWVDVPIEFDYEGEGNPIFHYTLRHADGGIVKDANGDIIEDDQEWTEMISIPLLEGIYELTAWVTVDDEPQGYNKIGFTVFDLTEFLQGTGSALNLIASLIIYMDIIESIFRTPKDTLVGIGMILSAITMTIISSIIFPPSPSAQFGNIVGEIIAFVMISIVTFKFSQGFISARVMYHYAMAAIPLALSIILLISQFFNMIFDFVPFLDDILDFIGFSLSVYAFCLAMEADKFISMFACKENWQVPHIVFIIGLLVKIIIDVSVLMNLVFVPED